jgi:hypothetical protein
MFRFIRRKGLVGGENGVIYLLYKWVRELWFEFNNRVVILGFGCREFKRNSIGFIIKKRYLIWVILSSYSKSNLLYLRKIE